MLTFRRVLCKHFSNSQDVTTWLNALVGSHDDTGATVESLDGLSVVNLNVPGVYLVAYALVTTSKP